MSESDPEIRNFRFQMQPRGLKAGRVKNIENFDLFCRFWFLFLRGFWPLIALNHVVTPKTKIWKSGANFRHFGTPANPGASSIVEI